MAPEAKPVVEAKGKCYFDAGCTNLMSETEVTKVECQASDGKGFKSGGVCSAL